jgi:hypothetical protein
MHCSDLEASHDARGRRGCFVDAMAGDYCPNHGSGRSYLQCLGWGSSAHLMMQRSQSTVRASFFSLVV